MGMPIADPLFGPFSANRRYPGLDNAGSLLQLVRPGTPPADEPAFTPLIVVDEVAYSAATPWPASPAAAQGDALVRVQPTEYGNFPTSWVGRPATPGRVDFVQRMVGDANGDGSFDSADVTQFLQTGKYMTGQSASWSEGDWTGDGLFDQRDILAALQAGHYLRGPAGADAADAVFGEVG